MIYTAQVDIVTRRVFATNISAGGLGVAPNGVEFVVYDPVVVGDPTGKYYVAGAFQVAKP